MNWRLVREWLMVALFWTSALVVGALFALLVSCGGAHCPPPKPSVQQDVRPTGQPCKTSDVWPSYVHIVYGHGQGYSRRSEGEARALSVEDARLSMDGSCVADGYAGVASTDYEPPACRAVGKLEWSCEVNGHGWCVAKDPEG